jgi:hypothetical protein
MNCFRGTIEVDKVPRRDGHKTFRAIVPVGRLKVDRDKIELWAGDRGVVHRGSLPRGFPNPIVLPKESVCVYKRSHSLMRRGRSGVAFDNGDATHFFWGYRTKRIIEVLRDFDYHECP